MCIRSAGGKLRITGGGGGGSLVGTAVRPRGVGWRSGEPVFRREYCKTDTLIVGKNRLDTIIITAVRRGIIS